MNTEELQKQGLTQEQINYVMAEYGKELNPIKADRDNLRTQLDNAQESLKEFEGIDLKNVEELETKVNTLTQDLKNARKEGDDKVADLKFGMALEAAIRKAGGRNEKAIMAMLDVDALKASKNQDKDIQAAIEAVKKESDYMFVPDKPVPKVVSSTPGATKNTDDLKTKANDALRSALGRG